MNADEIRDAYLKAAANGVACRGPIQDQFTITTSFMYSDGDFIDVWTMELNPGEITITDNGETFRKESDIAEIGPKDIEKASIFASGMGVELKPPEIFKTGKIENVGQLIFDVAMACQIISIVLSYDNRRK